MNKTQDITELLFPGEEPSEREKLENELWARASEDAYLLVGSKSPIALLRKTEELYKKYLREEDKK